jgi:Tol biopolymer transport system component
LSGELELFSNETTFNRFAWSPDGSALAATGLGGAYSFRPDGVLFERLSTQFDPVWYRDQMALAYTNVRADSRLELFSLKDSTMRVVSERSLPAAVSWLPDGESFVFESGNSFYKLNWRHGDETMIQIDPVVSRELPAVSPDGRWLAYSDANGIVVAPLEQRLGSVTSIFGPYTSPCWGPDNSEIAAVNYELAGITIIKLEGGKPVDTRDLNEGWNFARPAWSVRHDRVGSRITAEANGSTYVFSGDFDEEPFRLVNGGTQLSWSSDAGRIAFVRSGQVYIADSFTTFTQDQ